MAAEKLTRKRLIQLLIAMAILISAFLYRTCHYSTSDQPTDHQSAVAQENSAVAKNKKME